jgi:hypothetical protein
MLGFPAFSALVAAAIYPDQRRGIALGAIAFALVTVLVALLWWVGISTKGHRPLPALFGASPDRSRRPSDLSSLERMLGWQVYSEVEFNHRVRPVLRSILRSRLLERRGIDVDVAPPDDVGVPDPLRRLLAIQPPEGDENARIRTADLETMVAALERL